MSELRWVLLGLGLLLVAGVYLFWGRDLGLRRKSRSESRASPAGRRQEPSLGEESVEAFRRTISGDESPPGGATRRQQEGDESGSPRSGQPAPPPAATAEHPGESGEHPGDPADPRKIVSLHVAARGSERFGGPDLVAAFESEGLLFGQRKIYHYADEPDGEVIFSVANMVEPGFFDPDKVAELSTPGLTLFLVLPGPRDGAEAFSQMLVTARRLAQKLGGEVLDEQGSSLSNQTAGHIREEIIAFQLRRQALDDMQA